MQPLAFLFDMDGTLVDNMPVHYQVWVAYLAEHGVQVDPQTFHDLTAGKTNPQILRLFLGTDLSDADILSHSNAKEIRYRAAYGNAVRPLPGLIDFLTRAAQLNIPLALATSAGQENIDFTLERIGLTGRFQVIVNGEEVRNGKPDPEAFLSAAQRLGVPPERCLVFEDSRGGIEAAQCAGIPVIVLTTGLSEQQALAYPCVRMAFRDYTRLDPAALLDV